MPGVPSVWTYASTVVPAPSVPSAGSLLAPDAIGVSR